MSIQERLLNCMNVYPDFPKPGISFKDIMPVLEDSNLFHDVVENFCEMPSVSDADAVVGIDARGFLLASAICFHASKPLLVARKPGKLPGSLISASYDLEYGKNQVSMQQSLLNNHDNFVIIDDLLATGGTAGAVVNILRKSCKKVLGVSVLVELVALEGSKNLDVEVNSILKC